MRTGRARARRWLATILALLMVLLLAPGAVAANGGGYTLTKGWNPCDSQYEDLDTALSDAENALRDNGDGSGSIVSGIIASIFDGLTMFFFTLGVKPQCNLVYGMQTKLWPAPTFLHTFTETEGMVIKVLHPAFMALALGVFMVAVIAFSGVKIAVFGQDYRQRAIGIYTLQRVGVTALLVIISPVLISIAFDITHALVQMFASMTPIQDFMQAFRGEYNFIGTFLLRFFSLIILIALNLTYMLRRFALLVLVIVSPLCILAYAFDTTQAVTRVWMQEFVGNLLIQPVHAILFTVFFVAYGSSGEIFPAVAFLLVVQPLTNMLVSVFSGGRQSAFTGMGAATAMVGLAGAFHLASSVKDMISAARVGNVAARLSRSGGAMAAGGGGGAPGAAAAAPAAAGEGAEVPGGGAGTPGYTPPPSAAVQRMRLTSQRWRAAGKAVGAAVVGTVGAGIGMAGGNAAYGAMMGAAIGGKLGGAPAGGVGYLIGSTREARAHGGRTTWADIQMDYATGQWGGVLAGMWQRRQQGLYNTVLEDVSADVFLTDADKHEYVHSQVLGTMAGSVLGDTMSATGEIPAHLLGSFERGGQAFRMWRLGETLRREGLAKQGDLVELRPNGENMEVRINGTMARIEKRVGLVPGNYVYTGSRVRPFVSAGSTKPQGPNNPPPPAPPSPPVSPPPQPPSSPASPPPAPPASSPPSPPPSPQPPTSATPVFVNPGVDPFETTAFKNPAAPRVPTVNPGEAGTAAPEEEGNARPSNEFPAEDDDETTV